MRSCQPLTRPVTASTSSPRTRLTKRECACLLPALIRMAPAPSIVSPSARWCASTSSAMAAGGSLWRSSCPSTSVAKKRSADLSAKGLGNSRSGWVRQGFVRLRSLRRCSGQMEMAVPRSVLSDRGSATRRRLNQVDEVATGVFKQGGGDWPHALWLAAEADATLLETAVLRGDVIRYESSGWNTGGKQCCLIRLSRRKI